MKCAVEMSSGGMICLPSVMKIGAGVNIKVLTQQFEWL
jgi:hypothetical protein